MNTLIQPLPSREDFYETSNNYYSPFRGLFILEDIFQNAITETSDMFETPPEIKVPLRQHQSAMLAKMELAEKEGITGRQVFNETIFTNIGILGDRVGVGKSLMVLSHIARMKDKQNVVYNNTSQYNSPNFFSIKQYKVKDISSSTLIVVPHNLFRQWEDYIKSQTTLKPCIIKSKSPFMTPESEAKLAKDVLASDFTIVSNTIFSPFMHFCKKVNLEWKRVFIDEADSIHIVSTTPRIKAGFIWFITASWANILFYRDVRFTTSHLNHSKNYAFHSQVGKWLKKEMGSHLDNNYYYGTYFNMRSSNYFKDYISTHPLRGNIVLTSDPDFLESSIKMPPIRERIIECLASVSSMVVGGLINENVKNLLHAGDVKGALQALGANEDDNISIIQAVNYQRQKELDNYKKTLSFKETLEYATPQAKEVALKNLRDKIRSLEDQIKSLHDRIKNVSQELCGICYDDPDPATITPCCNQIFCGRCILTSMQKNPDCPMCRTPISGKKLMMIGNTSVAVSDKNKMEIDEDKPLKKADALLKLIRENPTGKFLVFSRYDNPFAQISTACAAEGISIREVKGNKDVINSTLTAFEKGDVRVLFLNSQHSGAGLNIISATHVVLLHAMTAEEQKQIVGRAYRLGRTADLNLVKLLHPGEA
jgi:SNF2 family DNA or RNA helicase